MKHPVKKSKHKMREPMKDLDKLPKSDAQKPFGKKHKGKDKDEK